MKDRINSYFAILLITIAGAGATMIIIHVAYSSTFIVTYGANQAAYAQLQ
jgi:hypothetical protein